MAKGLIVALALAIGSTASAQIVDAVDDKVLVLPPAPDLATVVMRLYATEMSGHNRITWLRLADTPSFDAPELTQNGFRVTYRYSLFGGQRDARVLRVAQVPAGRYVMVSRNANNNWTDSFCFGAPGFEARAGSVTYIGDYEVFMLRKMWDGQYRNGLRYEAKFDAAREALVQRFPAIAPAMTVWTPVNGIRFDCAGDEFTRYDVPGAPR